MEKRKRTLGSWEVHRGHDYTRAAIAKARVKP